MDIRCYRCLDIGHHQSDCTKDPVCYKCKEKGYKAVDCIQHKIQLFGFGIPWQGFYSLDIPEPQVKINQAIGVVVVQEGDADEERLNEELRLVVNEKWNFQARKIAGNKFLVVFPNKGTLETFYRFASFELPIYKFKVKISKSSVDPTTSSMLQTYWVRINNIPPIARDETSVREIATLIGQPLVVDELSLIRDDTVMVKVNYRDPMAIRCGIEIFFNKIGHDIKFIAEGGMGKQYDSKGGPPGPGRKDDSHDKPGRKDQWDAEGSRAKKKPDKEQDSSHGESQDAVEGNMQDASWLEMMN